MHLRIYIHVCVYMCLWGGGVRYDMLSACLRYFECLLFYSFQEADLQVDRIISRFLPYAMHGGGGDMNHFCIFSNYFCVKPFSIPPQPTELILRFFVFFHKLSLPPQHDPGAPTSLSVRLV